MFYVHTNSVFLTAVSSSLNLGLAHNRGSINICWMSQKSVSGNLSASVNKGEPSLSSLGLIYPDLLWYISESVYRVLEMNVWCGEPQTRLSKNCIRIKQLSWRHKAISNIWWPKKVCVLNVLKLRPFKKIYSVKQNIHFQISIFFSKNKTQPFPWKQRLRLAISWGNFSYLGLVIRCISTWLFTKKTWDNWFTVFLGEICENLNLAFGVCFCLFN